MRVLLLLAPLLAAGCLHGPTRHPHGMAPGQAKKTVVVEVGHVCLDACDHVFLDGVWYVETGHRHGGGCGHRLHNGKWIPGHAEAGGKGPGPKEEKEEKKEKKGKNK